MQLTHKLIKKPLKKAMSAKTFIKGTFILTLAGITTRVLGFFFKIFLSRKIGTVELGLYQMVLPIGGISYSISIAGIEIAMTRFTSSESEEKKGNLYGNAILCTAMSFVLSLLGMAGAYFGADIIAKYVFHNYECAALIKAMSFSFPLASLHAMFYSYYMGKENAAFPAISQLFEQIIRILAVLVMSNYVKGAALGIVGMIVGDLGSVIFSAMVLIIRKISPIKLYRNNSHDAAGTQIKRICQTAIPVSANRLMLHILDSIEAALIPMMLMLNGYTRNSAIAIYGIITGMVMPVILFPSTLTNSVSLMLLPSISKIQDSKELLKKNGKRALVFSVLFGFACILVFITFGAPLGAKMFDEPLVKDCIYTLAWLCPFIYITTTYKSMLNGLGKTYHVIGNGLISHGISIAAIVFLIPKYGICAYLYGLLLSQLVNALLNIRTFNRSIT